MFKPPALRRRPDAEALSYLLISRSVEQRVFMAGSGRRLPRKQGLRSRPPHPEAAPGRLRNELLQARAHAFAEFKGALTEQFVLQQLRHLQPDFIGYWANDKNTAKVDFLLQAQRRVIPIEVKAGESLQAKSFKFFCEKYRPAMAVHTSLSNYRKEPWMTNLPLYAIGSVTALRR